MPPRARVFGQGRSAGRTGIVPHIHINPKISVSVVFVAAMFMKIMDIAIVNVALPPEPAGGSG